MGDAYEPAKVYTGSAFRVVDTHHAAHLASSFFGSRLAAGKTVRFFVIGSAIRGQGGAADCDIPPEAASVFVNVTAVRPTGASDFGWLTLYPSGEARPTASTINCQSYTIAIASGVLVPLRDPTAATCDDDFSVNNANRPDVDLAPSPM